jgi:hypothetical protein
MEVIHKLTMHLDDRRLLPCLEMVQCDANTRVLELTLMSEGEAWQVPSGMAVSVAFRKSDGTAGWYDKLPDETAACSFSGNVVRAVLAPQVLTAWGKTEVAVVIQEPSTLDQIAVFPLCIEVARNPAAGKGISNDYYNYKTMQEINDAIDSLRAAVGTGGSGGSCGCSITVVRTGSADDPVSLSDYGIGAGDEVRFPEGDYYVEPFDMEGLSHVTFLLGDARIHCVGGYFLSAIDCDDLFVTGGTIIGGSDTVMGIQVTDCLRPVFQQVRFSGIGCELVGDTKGLFILGDCTGFLVDRCVIEDITSGVVSSDGFIHAYGILINRKGSDNSYSLKGEVRHCVIEGIAGIDTDTVKADGDGIFIQRPPYLDDGGNVAGIDQVIEIEGCIFENCKKRGVKSAAWGTVVRDCGFFGEFWFSAIEFQYGHGVVERCRVCNESNYTKSMTSGIIAGDGGVTIVDSDISCRYTNDDGSMGMHPGYRFNQRHTGSIFDASVPWDSCQVVRCYFNEVNYAILATTENAGVDTYTLSGIEIIDCRFGEFYMPYAVNIDTTVFHTIDVLRFVDFKFDCGRNRDMVRENNSAFHYPINALHDATDTFEVYSKHWLHAPMNPGFHPTSPHTKVIFSGDSVGGIGGIREKVYTAYGSTIKGSKDPNNVVSTLGLQLMYGCKLGDEYTNISNGKKYTCTTAGTETTNGVWREVGSGSSTGGYSHYVTPQMFGATGDGVNDDTDAVQAALDSGGEVFFPAGVYKVTRQLTTTKPCTIRMECIYPSANAEESDSMFSEYTERRDYPSVNGELGYGARIETCAVDGCGLLVTDGSSVDGLSIRAMDGFSGILFKYDGSKGFRSYPSTTRLRHIKVDCDTSMVVPEAMFDFQPHGTYGTVVEDVVIGSNHTRQFARYGFRSSLTYWANSIRLKDILVDVVAEQPFYINANGKQAKNWTISNVAIQAFPCKSDWLIPSHVNIAYLKGLSDLYISGCKLWDVDTTEGADNSTTVSSDVLYNGVISAAAFGNDSWFDGLDTILAAKLNTANELNLAKLAVTVKTSSETGTHTVTLSDGGVSSPKSFDIPATSLSDEQVAAAITEWMEENADPTPVVGRNKLNPEECYDGSLSNSGTESASTSYWTTGYIACGVGDVIRFIGLDGNVKALSYLFLFDEKKNFVEKVTDPSSTYAIAADGTAYIRYLIPKTGSYAISYDSRAKCMLTVNDSSTTYEPYTVTMEGGIAQYIDLDAIAAKIDLAEYLKKEDAFELYVPISKTLTLTGVDADGANHTWLVYGEEVSS